MRKTVVLPFSGEVLATFLCTGGLLFAQGPTTDVRSALAEIQDLEHRLSAAAVSGVPVTFAEQPSPSIRFHSGGVISGYAGVNQYFATIKVAADGSLTFDSPGFALTKLTAEPQRMELEARLLNTLQATRFIRVERDAIILEAEDRITTLKFARTSPELVSSKLLNVDWVLVRLTIGGADVMLPPSGTITLRFQDAGRISGRSAVNNYAGVFTATADGKIMIQPLAATQMLGPPELTALDTTYLDALSRVREIGMRSEEITLKAEAISMVFAARKASEASFGVAPGNTGR